MFASRIVSNIALSAEASIVLFSSRSSYRESFIVIGRRTLFTTSRPLDYCICAGWWGSTRWRDPSVTCCLRRYLLPSICRSRRGAHEPFYVRTSHSRKNRSFVNFSADHLACSFSFSTSTKRILIQRVLTQRAVLIVTAGANRNITKNF